VFAQAPVAVKGASITSHQEVRRGEDVLVKAEVRVASSAVAVPIQFRDLSGS